MLTPTSSLAALLLARLNVSKLFGTPGVPSGVVTLLARCCCSVRFGVCVFVQYQRGNVHVNVALSACVVVVVSPIRLFF